MHPVWTSTLLLFIFRTCETLNAHSKFIQEFLETESSRSVYILHCEDDPSELVKRIFHGNFYKPTNFININDDMNLYGWILTKNDVLFVFNLHCQKSKEMLGLMSKLNYFNKKNKYLFFGKDVNRSKEVLMGENFTIESHVLLITCENEHNYQIFHVKCPALQRNGLMLFRSVGNFTKARGLIYENPFEQVNFTMFSTPIKIATCMPVMPRNITFLEFSTRLVVSKKFAVSRLPMIILLLMSEMYNFKAHIIRSNAFGGLVSNTTNWDGVVGLLQRKEVDVGAHSVAFSTKRMPVLDHGFGIVKYRQSFIFLHPSHIPGMKRIFLLPFDEQVWWSLLATSICMIIALCVIHLAEKGLRNSNMEDIWTLSLINVVALVSQQGLSSDHLKSGKSKIVIMCSLFLSFICFQFYSASIVGSLLTPTPRLLTTLPKLTTSGLKIVMQEHPSSHLIFQVLPDPDVMEIHEKLIKGQEVYLSIEEGLQKVKTGHYALLIYYDDVPELIKATFTNDEYEELQVIPLSHQDHRAYLSLPNQKDSPFSEIFRVGVLKLIEVGLKDYHWKKWITNLNEKNMKSSFKTSAVDFSRVNGVFYLLFAGYFFSGVIFLIEIVVRKIIDFKNRVIIIKVVQPRK